jgi:putative aldouronate transport system permease protein
MYRADRITQLVSHIFLLILAIGSIIPFIILLSSSLSDEASILKDGYSFFPKEFSFAAYEYLLNNSSSIFRAYGITIFVTVWSA